MMTSDSFLFDAGPLVLSAWAAIVAVVSLAVFGPDLLSRRVRLDPAAKAHLADQVRPSHPTVR